ncbi:MAG: hypothetical protein LH610_08865 [Sphingomonas bacterium]|nr:hypothetical protein [Sphingomonas bacterium]
MLGTYRTQPEAGHEGMTIGVPRFRRVAKSCLDRVLQQLLMRSDPDEEK